MRWIVFWFVIGCVLSNLVGCATNRLVIVGNSVQSDISVQTRYEVEW